MIWVDYVFIGIVLLSVLVGVFRGLVREALSLVVWIVAFVCTLRFAPALADALEPTIRTPVIRSAAAYALLFFTVLILGALVTWVVAKVVHGAGLGGIDRALGAAFGALRGAFVVVALVLLAGASAARDEAWWTHSLFVPRLEPAASGLKALIPDQWLQYLQPRKVEPPSLQSRPEH